MDIKEFSRKMKENFDMLEISIEGKEIDEFFCYMNLLLEWNEKINLTSIVDCDEIIIKHFLDSASIIKHINSKDKVIDVGTGAGFPGVPLNILNKGETTLVDSLNKRINFLSEVVEKLKLQNISLIHSRAEELAQERVHREAYDAAVSRAVAPLNVLLEYTLPFVKLNGKLICMKGPNIKEELENSKNALYILGGRIEKIEEIKIGKEKMQRNIIIINKERRTPKEFPRKAGKPSKEPLV